MRSAALGMNDQEDMREARAHDPVSAIAEADATGETAALFADIRRTMQIPFVTSIWRTLAGVEGGLRAVWTAAKPLYASGQPGRRYAARLSMSRCRRPNPSFPVNWLAQAFRQATCRSSDRFLTRITVRTG